MIGRFNNAPKPSYVIWSNEHMGWWGMNRAGYENDIRRAGRYTALESEAIVKDAGFDKYGRPNEIRVPAVDADLYAERRNDGQKGKG